MCISLSSENNFKMIGAYTNCYFKYLLPLSEKIIFVFIIFKTILKWLVVLFACTYHNIVQMPYTFQFTKIVIYKRGYTKLQPTLFHLIHVGTASLYTLP